jgi:hypothetical protein
MGGVLGERMSAEPAVYTAPAGLGVELLAETLLEAFHVLRDAVAGGRPAIAVVRDADVLGHGEPAEAALANALVGLVRALATEGARDRWTVNALAVPARLDPDALSVWIDRLADPNGMTGGLVRLGELHLGRVPS